MADQEMMPAKVGMSVTLQGGVDSRLARELLWVGATGTYATTHTH